MISEIERNLIGKGIGKLSNNKDTFVMINLVPFFGIISFDEPEIKKEHEFLYSNYSNLPQGIVEKTLSIGEGKLTILESNLLLIKPLIGSDLLDFSGGKEIGKSFSIIKAIIGNDKGRDLRQVKLYQDVIIQGESIPTLDKSTMMFSVDLSLMFIKVPKIIEIPI